MTICSPFHLLDEIPGGGLGQIFRCHDASGASFVAKFPKKATPDLQLLVNDEERRFARFQGRNVVKYLGSIIHRDGRTGFAMEKMDGSLSTLLRHRGRLSELDALRLISGPAAGLRDLHGSADGAFHGDIKLGNILYAGKRAKLADFGLARGGAGQTTMLGPHDGGTPGYFPPEGFSSAAGDVYSLGASLWALLTGREPRPDEVLVLPTHVSSEVRGLLLEMLEPDRAGRCSAAVVAELLPQLILDAEARRREWWLGLLKIVGLIALAAVCVVVAVAAVVVGARRR